ncbi:MAG: hypothetical protein HZB33_01460 [Nitrospirae bacterium]|nr:hypothetical protein [Nitrospirota bacterium]
MSKHFKRLLLSFAVLAACCLPAAGMAASLSAPFGALATIDISGLRTFLDTLPPDEKDEQIRDWALYGLRSVLGLTSTDEMPVRHPALKASLPGEVSPGRVFQMTSKEWGFVVAPELISNKPMLGRLMDGKYASCNCLPKTVSLFTYSADTSSAAISIAFAGSVDAKDLFTPEYGYHSETVSTPADLRKFAAAVDDVVSFQWQSGSVLIGGRKYAKDARRPLTVEEIAALYQAYNAPAAVSAAGKSKAPPQPSETTVGFSLDPKMNYEAFGEDIRGIELLPSVAKHAADPSFSALLSRHRSDFIAIGEHLKNKHDIRPFLALRSRYEEAHGAAEARLRDALKHIQDRNSYLATRYNGKLQGTSLGMILFYTDLIAKLWSLDYGGMAPTSVRGFRRMLEIKIPKLYWDELLRLPKTRLWFGLRKEGFELYGNKILLQPVATRVYAASSDPAHPGRESRPNYQSSEFMGWWDTHYEAMAAAEPYYHTLDQIQKWSCIFLVLKEKKSHALDFLLNVRVRSDLDFEAWNKSETKTVKIGIPFLERGKHGCTTECLPLLGSRSYPFMDGYYMLSGGVTLASRKDILAKIGDHDARGNETHALSPEEHPAGAGALPGGGSAPRRASGHRAPADAFTPPAQGMSPEKRTSGAVSEPARRAGRGPAPVEDRARRAADRKYGTFSAEIRQGAVRLGWTKGSSLAPHELVASLAALQEADKKGGKGEEIFSGIAEVRSVVRVKKWNLYVVKTAASGDEWIYLAVNPVKADEYPARAAAAFLEADIFGAKLIDDGSARKLAVGNPVVR